LYEDIIWKILESSANRRRRQGETVEHTMLIKILNNRGPKWLPCGTPDDARKRLDDFPKRLTYLCTIHSFNYLCVCVIRILDLWEVAGI